MLNTDISVLAIPTQELKGMHKQNPTCLESFLYKWCNHFWSMTFETIQWHEVRSFMVTSTWMADPYWRPLLSNALHTVLGTLLQRSASVKHLFVLGLCEEIDWIKEEVFAFADQRPDMIDLIKQHLSRHPGIQKDFYQHFCITPPEKSLYEVQQYCVQQSYSFEETRQFWLQYQANMTESVSLDIDYFMSSKRSFDFSDSARQYLYHLQFCACATIFIDKVPPEKRFNLWRNIICYEHGNVSVSLEELTTAFILSKPGFHQCDPFMEYKSLQNFAVKTPLLSAMAMLYQHYQEAILLSTQREDIEQYLRQAAIPKTTEEISLFGIC